MTTSGNGNTTVVTVIDQIIVRLAALTPDKYIVPDYDGDADGHIVGVASTYLKRLDTLRRMLANELEPLDREASNLLAKFAAIVKTRATPLDLVNSVISHPELREYAERINEIEREMNPKIALASIVKDIFWAELRNQFPEVMDKDSVFINGDWRIGWADTSVEREDNPLSRLSEMLKRRGKGETHR